VPLFIFMGFITEQAGLMERLFTAFRMILAPVRGALYLVVVLTATVFAMATGIVGAAVTVLGIMAAPIMIKSGYDAKLSAGTITAGGTLGILIHANSRISFEQAMRQRGLAGSGGRRKHEQQPPPRDANTPF
jgi:TRAP-type mannitol/chloroaromatic compound transport system permease large subunit